MYIKRNVFFLLSLSILGISGCGDFFSHKHTERQTQQIFRDLGEVKIIPDVNRLYPVPHTPEPEIVASKDGVKIYYFARHNPPSVLAGLITRQLGNQVDLNAATNQLIVKCTDEKDANWVIELLEKIDVTPIQVKVDCLISEVFADLTIDYETDTLITDLLGKGIKLDSFLPGASLRDPVRSGLGMKAGVIREDFDALIDILESRGYAKILLHPVVEVVNGTTTRIETSERVPIQEQILSGGDIVTTIKYTDVVDYLEVTPQVYSDGTIGLKTNAGIGSRTIPEGVSQAPIITSRSIKSQENRLRKGESLVIGGILKTERTSVIRGVPFLKDIPLVGIFFSSKDFEDRAKEILFILTPSISSYGDTHSSVYDKIKEKHAMPEYKKRGIDEFLKDPFGHSAYTREIKKQNNILESDLIESEAKRAAAEQKAREAKLEMIKNVELLQVKKAETEKALTEAQESRFEAEASQKEAEQAKAEAASAKAEAEKAKAEAERIKKEILSKDKGKEL